jgi:hypothetical protein
MEEVEKKARVTFMNQQLIFRGKNFLLKKKIPDYFFFIKVNVYTKYQMQN